ncbi:MAG: DUF3772 domain-containing protein [Paracoccaceae bacterium]|nr:DUF3772 domain-containing protein [Paracoccaceae bacterium]
MVFARAKLLALLVVSLGLLAGTVFSQTSDIDYDLWNKQAHHAERQIKKDQVSESLRKQVADWRNLFQSAGEFDKPRIGTVQSQIEALGALPDDGAVDPLANRRSELAAELAMLTSPVAKALEAFQKADGLIREIDQKIRAEQASALVHLTNSPMAITAWPTAISEFTAFHRALQRELKSTLVSDTRWTQFKSRWISFATQVVVSLLLLFGAHAIVQKLADLIWMGTQSHQRLTNFIMSLLVTFLQVAGLCYLLGAVTASGLFDVRGTMILNIAYSSRWDDALQNWPLWLFGSIWLGQRLFVGQYASLPVSPQSSAGKGILLFGSLAGVLIVDNYFDVIAKYEFVSEQTHAIWNFLPILIGAVVLYRLSKLEYHKEQSKEEDAAMSGAQNPLKWRLIASLKRIAGFVALASPVLAAIGFINAATAIFYPFVQTVALLSFLLILQALVSDIYAAFISTTAQDEPDDALLPILIGFFLILVALPLFALIWGARSVDLLEIWNAVQKGIPIGDARLSPVNLLTFFVIFTIGYMGTRLLQSALKGSVLPKTTMDSGAQTAIVSGVGYLGIFLAAVIAISGAGLDLSSLAIVAGALSVGIGFGLQNIVSNFVSGIILLIERPVSEGDWIEVGGKMGYVRNISVRSTRIETFDRSDVIVPNADLVSGVVTNYTRGNTIGRLIIPVGVAYGTDTRRVTVILKEIIEANPMVLQNPGPSVIFQGFGVDSLNFEIRAILRDVNWILSVKSEVNHQIAARFNEEAIEIPFAQRDIWIKNPEALRGKD